MDILTFNWKKDRQDEYYQIVCNDYIKQMFRLIQNKKYYFYLDYNGKEDLDTVYNHYENKCPVDITKFYKHKIINHYSTFPLYKNTTLPNVDYPDMLFTITNFEDNSGLHEKASGCSTCNIRYGAGFWFEGLAHNVGEHPVEYEGYIKTYNFNMCNCDADYEITCSYNYDLEQDNVPYLEINCTPKDNKYNVTMLNHSILFNLKYTDNYTLNSSS
jgi:hypothetical protein